MLITLLVLVSSWTVFAAPGFYTCPRGRYFDEFIRKCEPCSECLQSSISFCDQCKADAKCQAPKYYDKNTPDFCQPCTDCKPGITPNQYCDAKCSLEDRIGPSVLAITAGPTTPRPAKVISSATSLDAYVVAIIVASLIVGLAVASVVAYCVWKRRRNLRHNDTDNQLETRTAFVMTMMKWFHWQMGVAMGVEMGVTIGLSVWQLQPRMGTYRRLKSKKMGMFVSSILAILLMKNRCLKVTSAPLRTTSG